MDPPHSTPPGTADRTPSFLVELGLAVPVTVADVEEAYRAKVKLVHPDTGGDQKQFIALQQAYERALAYANFRAGRRLWLAASIERYAEQEVFLDEIKRLGGIVQTERIDWLVHSIGEDFAQVLDQIVGLRLRGETIDDATIDFLLERCNLLAALHWLDLAESRVTDASVLRLKHFNSLRTLILRDTAITNAALHVVEGLPHLKLLYVGGSGATRWGRYRIGRAFPHARIAS